MIKRKRVPLAIPLAVLLASAAAGVAISAGPAQAKTSDLVGSYRANTVQCVQSGNNVRAKVKVRMRVVNYDGILKGDWAEYMQAKVRLEPTKDAGLSNWRRSWVSWQTPYLSQNKTHTYNLWLQTEPMRPDANWKVHLKLIWKRPSPHSNIKKDIYLKFSTSCASMYNDGGGGDGRELPATPVIPATNG